VTLSWGEQGGWYGYRYLVFAALPFAALGLSLWLDRCGRKARAAVAAWVVVPALMMLAFEGRSPDLSLAFVPGRGWVNDRYVVEVFETLVREPKAFAAATLKGGPAYLAYLGAHAVGADRLVPSDLAARYRGLPGVVALKSIVLWLIPLVFGWTVTTRVRIGSGTPRHASRRSRVA
jgi:hypothetical protein